MRTDASDEYRQLFSMSCYSYSTSGHHKLINEDAVMCYRISHLRDEIVIGAVIDGVSAGGAGQLASQLIISALEKLINLLQLSSHCSLDSLEHRVDIILSQVNLELYQYNQSNRQKAYAAMSCFVVDASRYRILHVGDTRVYLVGRAVRQLTRDHKVTDKNVLTNAIGLHKTLTRDRVTGCLSSWQYLLAISDGAISLVDIVQDDVQYEYFVTHLTNQDLVDNASFVVVRHGDGHESG